MMSGKRSASLIYGIVLKIAINYEAQVSLTFIIFQLLYIPISNMKNQRRVGEALTIVCGVAIAGIGGGLGILSLVAGGLAIMGLGVVSVFWR
jgi:hypothetical protein